MNEDSNPKNLWNPYDEFGKNLRVAGSPGRKNPQHPVEKKNQATGYGRECAESLASLASCRTCSRWLFGKSDWPLGERKEEAKEEEEEEEGVGCNLEVDWPSRLAESTCESPGGGQVKVAAGLSVRPVCTRLSGPPGASRALLGPV